jgi:hypothetical protein
MERPQDELLGPFLCVLLDSVDQIASKESQIAEQK